MKQTKIFLTAALEKKWLDQMSQNGFELLSRKGFSYEFKKSSRQTFYQYVFLKHGKKSFLQLDYKKRDPKAKLVYGGSEFALFKRKGECPQVLAGNNLKINYLTYIQGQKMRALSILVLGLTSALAARIVPLFWAAFVCCAVAYALHTINAAQVKKML